jgi:hypothetical protein
MSKLEEAQAVQQELEKVLDLIPVSGSFESAKLAKQASSLTDRVISLCSSWTEEVKAGSRGKESVASVGKS